MLRLVLALTLVTGCLVPDSASAQARKPNVVIILTDDQGYADVSYNPHHPREVHTPNIDKLARRGVICTQGYVSGNVCSPTRAGLLTGRYQQRFGVYTGGEGGSGVPLSERYFPQYLRSAGYVSGAFGKWHQGVDLKYNPIHRGFDEFYGFMGRGAHDYFKLDDEADPLYRGLKPVQDKGYLTHRITDEAVSFIQRHKSQPFLLYVAFNAVHSPAQAPKEDIKAGTGDPLRDTLMAMIKHLDDGVGRIVGTLDQEGLFNNTLLCFLTDNGGAKNMHANNAPLRGFKHQNYEGGVRVPFIVSWPDRLKGGTKCDVPLMSIDILPTALAAAGVPLPEDRVIDGKDMLPALRGKMDRLHEHLFWSSGGDDGQWAVRAGDWKLVTVKDRQELFDLGKDVGETIDLAKKHPEQAARLTKLYDEWIAEMAEPLSGQPKRWSADQPAPKKKKKKKKPADDCVRVFGEPLRSAVLVAAPPGGRFYPLGTVFFQYSSV